MIRCLYDRVLAQRTTKPEMPCRVTVRVVHSSKDVSKGYQSCKTTSSNRVLVGVGGRDPEVDAKWVAPTRTTAIYHERPTLIGWRKDTCTESGVGTPAMPEGRYMA